MAKSAAAAKRHTVTRHVKADSGDDAFPVTLFRACKKSVQFPLGYEARQFDGPSDVALLDPAVWKASPADLA